MRDQTGDTRIMSVDPNALERLHVELGERGYDILIGAGIIATAGELIAPVLKSQHAIIVTDANVASHWLDALSVSLSNAGISTRAIILPPGEATKNMAQLGSLLDDLLDHQVDRKTTLIALGGGVIGDLTGFAAAITLRGIDFIQVPTTLLAQVDSSVGGKTGIDTKQGKNLVGAFHQPRLVLIDTETLNTLPLRDRRSGYAEVVKYGVINDRGFFDWLCAYGSELLNGHAGYRREAILRSCRAKATIVAEDEREAGRRALLNLGHTFAHALEAEAGFDDALTHGEAVAIGMVMACALAEELDLASPEHRYRLVEHLKETGLPHDLTGIKIDQWTADSLIAHMGKDKKTESGKLTFILPHAVGDTYVVKDVPTEPVRKVLNAFLDVDA